MTASIALPLPPIERLARLPEREQSWALRRLTVPELRGLLAGWWAHEGQEPPEGDWRVWLMLAGRGFGKTRAGAEYVSARARADGSLRIALVGATHREAAEVMVLGESGLKAVARADEDLLYYPSRGLVEFASGARAFLYSGRSPGKLRGPQHHLAWCDELAKWRWPEETWTNLMLGLRLGDGARAVATTTPKPIALIKALIEEEGTRVTRGRTWDNDSLPADYVDAMTRLYGGTRLGRQELEGALIDEAEGALWTRTLIEARRAEAPETLRRVLIGVDPPASATGDECGIVACGIDADGIGHVLGDHSVGGKSPEGWARAVVRAAELWEAERVIVETNQGGEMVEAVLRGADCALPVKAVKARFGKGRRAEPVALRFEAGKARFAGSFPELEDQLCGMTVAGYDGPGRSPDRADAMVWAMGELLLGKERAPRVRGL